MRRPITISILFISALISSGSLCKRPSENIKEARGLWVTRWEWAIEADSQRVEMQQRRIVEILNQAQTARLNFVVFQIRGNGDALYRSNYEPWSHLLSDTLGKDPGWDPLAFALEEAHNRGLELHAWFNTFPAWRGTEPPLQTNPLHVYLAHPEWLVCDLQGKSMPLSPHYVSLSPGIPEAREYIHRVAMDIVQNYDIDGFHFDYIRYPEDSPTLGYSHDSVSVRLFNSAEGNPQQFSWEDWQRENINQFVRKFYDEATAQKPWLKISAAVIGSYDQGHWNGYHVVFQDARKWLAEGKMDFLIPMIYWQIDHPTHSFEKLTIDWLTHYKHERYIFPGMMINRVGDPNWPLKEMAKQISLARENSSQGFVFFSHSGLEKIESMVDPKEYPFLANLPPMPWKDENAPEAPANFRAFLDASGSVQLVWNPPVNCPDVTRYNIFRSEKSPVDITSARYLIHITSSAATIFYDETAKEGNTYYYVVTALDRVNNESAPSHEIRVRMPRRIV